jgi:molybdate transport system substrate-binding protein
LFFQASPRGVADLLFLQDNVICTSHKGNRMRRAALFLALVLALAGCRRPGRQSGAPAREVTVAAAADVQFALHDLIAGFRRKRPEIAVQASYGSSGGFYSQLLNRAPFDLFFSADLAYPRRLAAQGLALPGTEFCYAVGRIVVWVPRTSPIDVERLGIQSLACPSVRRIAIANPRHAPYGRAAQAALRRLGLYGAVEARLVYGENIAQAFQFVQSGAADIGIVALSLALAPGARGQGRYWEIPPDAYPPMEQGGIILKWARDPEAARSFRSYVVGEEGRAVWKRYGFYLPGE